MAKRAKAGRKAASAAGPRPIPSIFVGGLIAGVLDLAYAIVVYTPSKPILIPQTVATGVLGIKAYFGGFPTAALGVVLHFIIALGAATVFYLASRRLTLLVERPVLSGMIFGALVYLFMHWIVLPLSAAPHGHPSFIHRATEFVEHWFFVGLPISLSVKHYSRR